MDRYGTRSQKGQKNPCKFYNLQDYLMDEHLIGTMGQCDPLNYM